MLLIFYLVSIPLYNATIESKIFIIKYIIIASFIIIQTLVFRFLAI